MTPGEPLRINHMLEVVRNPGVYRAVWGVSSTIPKEVRNHACWETRDMAPGISQIVAIHTMVLDALRGAP